MGNAKSSDIKDVDIDTAKLKKERKTKSEKQVHKKSNIGSQRSSMSSQGNRRPILTMSQRAIIKYCIDNAKDDIADRILRRERKEEYRGFLEALPRKERTELAEGLKDFLRAIGENLTDSEDIQKSAEEFGSAFVPYRSYGFRPDFFALTADAVTTECTFLDQATHTASETAAAWSQLSAFVFSAVRDGYYAELRRQRKCSSAFRARPSVDVSTDGSVNGCNERRSLSPGADDSQASDTKEKTDSSNFLLPPQVY